MQAAYSVLFFKENYIQQRDRIGQLLGEGKKVFWFGAIAVQYLEKDILTSRHIIILMTDGIKKHLAIME